MNMVPNNYRQRIYAGALAIFVIYFLTVGIGIPLHAILRELYTTGAEK
jgi:hypothetical protein